MQIEYDGQIISNAGTDGPQTIRAAPTRVVDAHFPLRGAFGVVHDRTGKSNVLAWTQQRTHASTAAAEVYLFAHIAGLPDGRHNAIITTEAGTVHILSDAVLLPGRARQRGCVTWHDYELRGGAITGTTPNPLPPRGPAHVVSGGSWSDDGVWRDDAPWEDGN